MKCLGGLTQFYCLNGQSMIVRTTDIDCIDFSYDELEGTVYFKGDDNRTVEFIVTDVESFNKNLEQVSAIIKFEEGLMGC